MTIGILGGGQLGKMLVLAGAPLGIEFRVFDPSADAVAGHLAPLWCEDINDVTALEGFSKSLDAVTYEWENVPVASAQYLAGRAPVFPPPLALEISSDRIREKSFFTQNGVPTPRFAAIETRADLGLALEEIGLPCVLKTRRFGYDGKGQCVLQTARDVEAAWQKLGGAALILEEFIAFEREVSLLAVRARDGEKRFYPLVANDHRDGILRLSVAPAPDVTPELQLQVETYASKILDELGYVGVLALELFQNGQELMANEIAPRVHNSGHWTIEGSACSQFENHLRAIAGLPLGSTQMRAPCAAMVNLIGALPPLGAVLEIEGAHAHFYGKELKPGRKVGHITLVAETRGELEKAIERAQKLAGEDSSNRT